MRAICAKLGNPERSFKAIHIAGTNGKGAVAALLDSCFCGGRYTSPHLMRINERFFLHGRPADDLELERIAARVIPALPEDATFFEALTAVAFAFYAEARPERTVMESGLGGRLDAVNVCNAELCAITRIGLDHCDWLGRSIAEIAAEKAGIVKPGVPVVVARNCDEALETIRRRAEELDAPFVYAPDIADESEIPAGFPLKGAFNRENAVTALAVLKTLGVQGADFSKTVWPGRFQEVGRFIVDGAHNPPAAAALAAEFKGEKVDLIAGFCGDKDVLEVLRILSPHVRKATAVKTNNPRSLTADETAAKMREAGMDAVAQPSGLKAALSQADASVKTLVCGSLFLAGEALVALDAFPWGSGGRFDASESLGLG
jgi:dihydrofolate synthase/folylpolyglutamate synthase